VLPYNSVEAIGALTSFGLGPSGGACRLTRWAVFLMCVLTFRAILVGDTREVCFERVMPNVY
jgi:hypothetical protein